MDGLWVTVAQDPRGGFGVGESHLSERFSHSSGPGGQGVNTSSSRVELSLDVAGCPDIPEALRQRILTGLSKRLVAGVLTVAASQYREQLANRRAARQRMAEMLSAAARPVRSRRRSRPTRGSRRRRLEDKRRRSRTKADRRPPTDW
ncbi:alternative ribosome rescue aminoacyl-tRNA hydrolase ArfB [Acidipropionibacterium jensenii]|uniref:Peptidyl-tRNA hydrolase YaeJ n=1 Tax=Acidipropionibacterium jensenii TaxID=1749 RepID=A0A3S4W6R3_9ACTN|nr:alternative ribosome rescue aminoacyl-tRNA hydrolase ArfB [Acidipropionibacterium jensenii]MDN5976449.1 aminoacyl-tRNA hydrolase [Acidipropionibacterium jensenii]MDN5996225.1 aminoacyl-tRNA hydrolase [Acidipropionibacterium jensenii]MDN6425784.1 aminoacyl-tRNA hydrolase [Acidipropionibacterium jensenii]MDN6440992.1 aminoacyl-tRNA hydrolase [Acidipropionibacterium jensenii]MDN6479835.1 aminoacyl-tRNA hydrolase [Acidipropionibacterium jensenii]